MHFWKNFVEIIWPLASQWFLLENTSQNRLTYISFLDTSWKLDLNLTGHENSTTHFNLIYMLWYVIIWVGSRGLILLVGYVYLPIKIFDIQMTLPEMTTVELSFFFTVGNFAILEIFFSAQNVMNDGMTLIFASGYVFLHICTVT